MRKVISFKLDTLSENDRRAIDNWADGQTNIQQSLANLLMHVISWSGNQDVLDFKVQRMLHTMLSDKPAPTVAVNQVAPAPEPIKEDIAPAPVVPTVIDQSMFNKNKGDDNPLTKAKNIEWD